MDICRYELKFSGLNRVEPDSGHPQSHLGERAGKKREPKTKKQQSHSNTETEI